jgi:hypothetical protein
MTQDFSEKWNRFPTSFKVPKGYRRRFVFKSRKFKYEIRAGGFGGFIETRTVGVVSNETEQSRCLDWIMESMMLIRVECGAEK